MWWEWHDGVPAGDGDATRLGVFEYFQLADSIAHYRAWQGLAQQSAAESSDPLHQRADAWWRPSWFPITETASGPPIVCDCAGGNGEVGQIYLIDWEFPDRSPMRVANSFGEVVDIWIEALNTRLWKYDPARQGWDRDEHLYRTSPHHSTGLL